MWLWLLACGTEAPKSAPIPDPGCWDDLALGDVAVVSTGFMDGTEGLTFSDGRLYVGTDTEVFELLPDGTPRLVWENDHVLGLAADGAALLVADQGEFSMGGDADGEIWALSPDGQANLRSDGWSNPNFLLVTPWGTVLMADDTEDVVVELQADGTHSVWLEVPSPNGMVLSPDAGTLYVASTFVPDASVWSVAVSDGVAGPATLVGTTTAGGANDGVAIGPDAALWVAANLAGELWRFTAETAELRVSGLNSPASIQFGVAPEFDPCSIYSSSLFGEDVVRVVAGPD